MKEKNKMKIKTQNENKSAIVISDKTKHKKVHTVIVCCQIKNMQYYTHKSKITNKKN